MPGKYVYPLKKVDWQVGWAQATQFGKEHHFYGMVCNFEVAH